MNPTIKEVHEAMKPHWPRLLIISTIGILLITVVGQLLYPANRLTPNFYIDSVSLGGLSKDEAISKLNKLYSNEVINIYFGSGNKRADNSPKASELGIVADNKDRVNRINYPIYLRIIPSSILWFHFLVPSNQPAFSQNSIVLEEYINKELGATCDVKPQDASLKVVEGKLELVPSHNGGTCDLNIVKQKLSNLSPKIGGNKVLIPYEQKFVNVDDAAALKVSTNLEEKTKDGVVLNIDGTSYKIPQKELYSWLEFGYKDNKLIFNLNATKANDYLVSEIASKVSAEAGVTTVYTHDFAETSRTEGKPGRKLDVSATISNIESYVDGITNDVAAVATTVASPRVVYERTYSSTDTGLSAFIQQYAQDHAGVFGVSLIELSGQHRRASFNGNRIFTPGSTYKLFVAYSSLLKVESGAWHMTDPIVDVRDLDACFEDMLVWSRNTCAEALIIKLGRAQITNDAHSIGCLQTSFMKNGELETTPEDLATYMAQLATGQLLATQTSRDKIISSLKQSPYKSGIPAGIKNAEIINKIGVIWNILNDVAIVYSPTGNYILSILTEGSNWGTIADFASKIEALRSQ